MQAPDPFNLERFVSAQAPVYEAVLSELASSRKRSHWMWFIFPQLRGLGNSSMAKHYGIASLEEARAYLAHPLLGTRLRECCGMMLAARGSAYGILGAPDDLKFRSCLTLFALAAPEEPMFRQLVEKYYGGVPDERTVALTGH